MHWWVTSEEELPHKNIQIIRHNVVEALCYALQCRRIDRKQSRTVAVSFNNWLQDVSAMKAFFSCVQHCRVHSWRRPTWSKCRPALTVVNCYCYVIAHNQFTYIIRYGGRGAIAPPQTPLPCLLSATPALTQHTNDLEVQKVSLLPLICFWPLNQTSWLIHLPLDIGIVTLLHMYTNCHPVCALYAWQADDRWNSAMNG